MIESIENYDLLVVGSGFCGSVIANLAAADGKKVLVLEKRPHIAGNMYDYVDANGTLVQKYGPHAFHTDNDEVAEYLRSIDEWRDFNFTYAVALDGENVPAPFGFATIDRYYSADKAEELKRHLLEAYPKEDSVVILDLLDSDDRIISEFGKLLYEKNYLPYALKQWQLPPEELSREIIGRMPVRLSDIEAYYQDKYQMLPAEGFTVLFTKMLDHPNIDIYLKTDALDHLSIDNDTCSLIFDGTLVHIPVVYTGPLENLLLNKTGVLPYRSLRIEFETVSSPSYHEYASVSYPSTHDYLRTTDYSKFTVTDKILDSTTVGYEYPTPYDPASSHGAEPYYPILTDESEEDNRQLQNMARRFKYLVPCGRLADFHYYNMDKAVERAFEVYRSLKESFWS